MTKRTGSVRAILVAAVFLMMMARTAGAAAPKVKIPKEKQLVLDLLATPETVEKFGKISDAIWSYAELGLQEFKSSKLLADTLEGAGFMVERGLAGMPTCFVATYGEGRPVVGLLGEFDALPMLSQKGRVAKKEPVVEIMDIAANFLREHLPLYHRLHYVILEGGEAPNVVPDRASVWYYIRSTDEGLADMFERVVNCAKAGALATGTELEPVRIISAVHQSHSNKAAAEVIQKNIELVGMPSWTDEEQTFAKALQKELKAEEKGMPSQVEKLKGPGEIFVGGGSTDVGDVTLIVPTATIGFPGGVPGTIGHHWSAVACYNGSTAWKGLNAGAKAIAASAIDLLTRPEELKKLRAEFEEMVKKAPYKPFLPADAQPPTDLNERLMRKWRPPIDPY